ncbi:Calcium-transporting ATPase 4, endoplasmic reticulum-type [Ancistrocladus abbreviatus]
MSKNALQCLGFAYKVDLPEEFSTYNGDHDHPAHKLLLNLSNYLSIESKLIFVGFVGIRDTSCQEARQAIGDWRATSVRVIVVMGDKKNTTEAICREIGCLRPNEDFSSRSLTGRVFMEYND